MNFLDALRGYPSLQAQPGLGQEPRCRDQGRWLFGPQPASTDACQFSKNASATQLDKSPPSPRHSNSQRIILDHVMTNMAQRRVICDSEDEDGDFSDLEIQNPAKAQAVTEQADTGIGAGAGAGGDFVDKRSSDDPNSGDARSTDPDFFRQLYEEQQTALATLSNRIPDTFDERQPETQTRTFVSSLLSSSSSSSVAAAAAAIVIQQRNSSSLTDPGFTKKKKDTSNKPGTTESKDLSDMTQVTTPDAPVTKRKDIWDFDFDDDEGTGAGPSIAKPKFKAPNSEVSASKVKNKRKRSTPKAPFDDADAVAQANSPQLPATAAHGSSANHPIELDDDHDDDESPKPTRKKRKSGDCQQSTAREVPDDVDLLVIPTTWDNNDNATQINQGDTNSGSTINDTLEAQRSGGDPILTSSLVIVPPSLTASQKQQYLRVSGSSELEQDSAGPHDHQQQASLPAPKPQTPGLRSSTKTESTIPYTTPSGYGSSLVPLSVVDNLLEPSSERRTQQIIPDCSPDELSTHPVESMSRTKKRKNNSEKEDQLAEDDAWNSDNVGYSRENYVPRPSKRRSRALLEDDDEAPAPEPSMPDTCPPGETGVDEFGHTQEIATTNEAQSLHSDGLEGLDPDFLAAMPDDIRQEIINSHKSAGNTQTARTRSRARPNDASSGPVPTHEETPQPKKRGRKKKVPANDDMAPLEADEPAAQPSPAPAASAKKRRGRPKKSSEPAPPAAAIEDDRPAEEDESGQQFVTTEEPRRKDSPPIEEEHVTPQATKTKGKRGRKKKTVEETLKPAHLKIKESTQEVDEVSGMAQDDNETVDQNSEPSGEDASDGAGSSAREALRDISNMVTDKTSIADHNKSEIDKDDSHVSKSKDIFNKAASTPTQQDKVRFRVGLSKRSRIAPLLKMIRK